MDARVIGILAGAALMEFLGAARADALQKGEVAAQLEATAQETLNAAGMRDIESIGEILSRRMDGSGVNLPGAVDARMLAEDAVADSGSLKMKAPGSGPVGLSMAPMRRHPVSRAERSDEAVTYMAMGFGAAAGFLFGSVVGGLTGGLVVAVLVAGLVAVIWS